MELIACAAPIVTLDSAPGLAMRGDLKTEQWDGFRGEDEGYYLRLTRLDSGAIEWYRIADSAPPPADSGRRRVRERVARKATSFPVRELGGLVVRDAAGRPRISCMVWRGHRAGRQS
jgi:hypothetical protein